MIIKFNVSDEVINEVCEEYGWSKNNVVDNIRDYFGCFEDDNDLFKEKLVNEILNI